MDGVLIDVSGSYRKAIIQTVEIYLTQALGFKKACKPLVEDRDVATFKEIGGFNNDWDLAAGLLLYFLSLAELRPSEIHPPPGTLDEILRILRSTGQQRSISLEELSRKKDLQNLARNVRRHGIGLKGIQETVEPKGRALVFSEGDLDKTHLVKRIFQEVYLGPHFYRNYRLSPRFYKGKGLYLREKLLIRRDTLEGLCRTVRLGIASGRPRSEALLALNRFDIEPYFESLVALEDCEEEEFRRFRSESKGVTLSKPHPFSIVEAVRRISPSRTKSAYVGDLLDDMVAANRAKKIIDVLAIGCLAPYKHDRQTMREWFQAHGADLVIDGPDDLLGLLASGPKGNSCPGLNDERLQT
jgi:HAD superfamily hydrolase (TIGR01548 family)